MQTQQMAFGTWLGTRDWSYFCTFTTQYKLSKEAARRAIERFYNSMKKTYKEVALFWVAEPCKDNGGYHLHALIYLPQNEATAHLNHFKRIQERWRAVSGNKNNYSTIKDYKKDLGANSYVTKTLDQKDAAYGIF